MATLTMSAGEGIAYFTISGLSAAEYADIGVALSPINHGTQIPPSQGMYGTGHYVPPPTSVSGSFFINPGTYMFYAYGCTMDYYYWNAGSCLLTIPDYSFSWDVPKTVGSSTITVSEWDRLINFITNKVGNFDVDYPLPGDTLSALKYNQLINGMGASSSYLVAPGQPITAAKLNLLVTLANNL